MHDCLLSKMSNHCERISSTARFFDSTLTFDFWEAPYLLNKIASKPHILQRQTVFFIINTIVLMLENRNF